jgi:hypothetical protein
MHQKQMVQMHPVYFFYSEGDLDDLDNRDYNNTITVSVMLAESDCEFALQQYLSLQVSLPVEN